MNLKLHSILKKSKLFFLNFHNFLLCSVIFIIIRIFKFKICNLNTERFGHCIILLFEANINFKDKKKIFLTKDRICNTFLLEVFKKYSRNNFFFNMYGKFYGVYLKFFNYFDDIIFEPSYKNYKSLENNDLKFFINKKFENDVKTTLNEFNIKENYICIFARDNLYLNNIKYNYHSFRDFNIGDFNKLIDFFLNKNFSVVRIGKNHNKKINNLNVIDFPFLKKKTDKSNLLILANCKFFFGNQSGINLFTKFLNNPTIVLNAQSIYFANCMDQKYPLLFKKYFDLKKERCLSLKEIIEMNIYEITDGKIFDEKNIKYINNSELDILNLGIEAYKRFNNEWVDTKLYNEKFLEYKNILNFYKKKKKIKFLKINDVEKNFFMNFELG
jgi:putative glycosyltransferase (TIGR04372 family)